MVMPGARKAPWPIQTSFPMVVAWRAGGYGSGTARASWPSSRAQPCGSPGWARAEVVAQVSAGASHPVCTPSARVQ